MSGRGKPLELGLQHAANAYLKAGRAAVVRQYPRMAAGPGGTMRYAGEAPIDFLGARAGGAALALEAKETNEAQGFKLNEDHLSRQQINACRALASMAVEVFLVIDYKREVEVYQVPWRAVDAFLATPWRASLPLLWARAHGLLLPERDRDDVELRRTLFLDGVWHPAAEQALEEVERERAATPVMTLDELLAQDDARDQRWVERRRRREPEGETLAQLLARKPKRDAPEDEQRRWLDEYTARELADNTRRAKKLQRGQPAAWKGGNGR